MQTRIVPRLNDEPNDFAWLAGTAEIVLADEDLRLDFSKCDFIRYIGVAAIGGLVRLADLSGTTLHIDEATLQSEVRSYLLKAQFPYIGGRSRWSSTAVPYLEQREADGDRTRRYLSSEWLCPGPGRISVSERLTKAIINQVWEIYANSWEHAASAAGVFTCGQFFPNRREVALGIVDYGVGIPYRVRSFLDRPHLGGSEAMRWAFESGNSTSERRDVSRGLGLDLLRDFVQTNAGSMTVVSGDGTADIRNARFLAKAQNRPFPGTLVCIRLRCDDSHYILASEDESGSVF